MDSLPVIAAISAAAIWAIAGLIAFAPVRKLGVYRFAKIQVFSCAMLVGLFAASTGRFASLKVDDWWSYLASGLLGVLATNLAFSYCVRRGGPRRAEVLSTSNVIFSGVLGVLFLNETMTLTGLLGCVLVTAGVLLAVVWDKPSENSHALEQIDGSVAVVVAAGVLAGLFQALGLLVLKQPMVEGLDPIAATAMRLITCALAICIFELVRGQPLITILPDERRIAALAVMPGFLGYVVASACLIYAVGQRNVTEMMVLGSLAPILILPFQWVITRQNIGVGGWMGAVLAVIGVYLVA
jgi:drug/metabolite transporter (DMT)-like permease